MYYDPAREFSDGELERIRRRLAREYSEAASAMEERQKALMASYERERSQMAAAMDEEAFERWCEGQAARSEWIGSMSGTLARYAADADRAAVGGLRDSMADVFAESANWAAFDVESRTLVDTAFTLLDRDAVVELARDDPKLLPAPRVDVPKDMAWNRRHMSSALTQGIVRGEPVDDIAGRLRSVIDMDRRAAMRTARTAVNHAENAGKMSSYRRAAAMGIGLRKEWVATLDDRTRDSHRHLDGEIRDLDEPFSNGLMEPSDPDGAPAEVYNCRCRVISVPDGVDTSGAERNSRLGAMSYEQWKGRPRAASAPSDEDAERYIRDDTVTPENDESMRDAASKLDYATPTVETDEGRAYWHDAYAEAFMRNSAHHMSEEEAARNARENIEYYIGRDAYDAGSRFFGPDNYGTIQRGLRTGDLSDEAAAMVRDIDRAIDLGDTLNFDTALIRYETGQGLAARMGVGVEDFYGMSDDELVSALAGKVMTEPGYSSTAFAPLRSVVTEESDVVMNIVARSDTPVLFREGAQEHEVLLGRGTDFHIVGVRTLHAEEYVEWADEAMDVRRIILDVVV